QTVEGYTDHTEVASSSQVETFVALKLVSKHPKWKDLPIYLRTGKRLHKKYFDIHIVFKALTGQQPNILTFRVSPSSGINLRLWQERDGDESKAVDLTYCYRDN